jgi:hypothetical protein
VQQTGHLQRATTAEAGGSALQLLMLTIMTAAAQEQGFDRGIGSPRMKGMLAE